MAAANIGIMDGAYFVGRNEILQWINTSLQLNLTKVEEVSVIISPLRSGWMFPSLSGLSVTTCMFLGLDAFL